MYFKNECPYCHGVVHDITYSNKDEGIAKQYAFYCDCTYGALRYNIEQAYESYLHERENVNLINYDVYFENTRTYEEFELYLDNWCREHEDLECRDCIFGQVGDIIATNENKEYGNCFELIEWLGRKASEKKKKED